MPCDMCGSLIDTILDRTAVVGGYTSAGFWHDRRRRPTHRVPWTRETAADREQLWRECERLAGRRENAGPNP